VACVSSEEETKGIAERVSGMKDEKEKLERLLQRNADEQLADFGWDQLNAAISSRVDQVEKGRRVWIKRASILKIAAGIAAAAAVVVVAVTVHREKPPVIRLHESGAAMVELIGRRGSASVEIEHATSRAYAMVAIGPGEKKLAKCDIEVIDSNGSGKASDSQAAWIIISRPEPMYADNGFNKDIRDMICLF
jgi:hypothetical protein